MRNEPTRGELNILKLIDNYITEKEMAPTIREICDMANLSSTAPGHSYVEKLIRKGLIEKIQGSPRSIKVTEVGKEKLGKKNEDSCNYCRKTDYPLIDNTTLIDFYEDDEESHDCHVYISGNKLMVTNDYCLTATDIKYCPKCGRKLEVD